MRRRLLLIISVANLFIPAISVVAELISPIGQSSVAIRLEAIPGAFNVPADMAADSRGRCFVMELAGVIRVIDEAGILQESPYHISNNQNSFISGEAAMTSISLHPDFMNEGTAGYGKFYTIESEVIIGNADFTPEFAVADSASAHHSVIYEYKANPQLPALSGTKREMM